MSETEEKTLLERVERCEQGLTAIETILRATFPQFFEPTGANDNGEETAISETEGGVKTEHQEGAGSSEEEGKEAEEKVSE